ncbi:MAG: pirin family protein, partial [Pseudomonadota bacterium]
EGEIWHRDSLGTSQAIRPGAVNWMRAGAGIVHSERTAPERRDSGQHLFGMQTWVALPQALEESAPDFVHHGADALPAVTDGALKMRLIAGETHGLASPLETASATLYADVALTAGGQFQIEAKYTERAIYILSGALHLDNAVHEAGRLLILRPGEAITVAAQSDARFMVFGGEPMEGPRYIWWNFVSSRRERIEAAKEEWAKGRFDTVPGDEEEFIPLPDTPGKPRRAVGGTPF